MNEFSFNTKPITIPDIAFAAGVSRTTVSMILNGKADRYRISASTRQRVEAIAAQSGYQPNQTARNMRMGRGTLVGLILPDGEGSPDVGELIAGLEPVLANAGYSLVVISTGPNLSAAHDRIRRLNHDGLAGLIYGPGFPIGSSPITAGLGPTIILGLPAAGLPGIYHDDEQNGRIRPTGMRRSERTRGQIAGTLLLSLSAGAPPVSQCVALIPLPSPPAPILNPLPAEPHSPASDPAISTPIANPPASQEPAQTQAPAPAHVQTE
jgi:hypothetical protein